MKPKQKNTFSLFEWSGAFGDIGILLPLAFAFVIFNGYSPRTLFLLWGVAYIATGFYYKVPVSVQPLKAMAVIAIAGGFLPHQLSSTAFFYGIILVLISLTGVLKLLQAFFTPAIVRGIQVGIGLILVQKAAEMVVEKGLFLGWESSRPLLNVGLMLLAVAVLWFFQFRKKIPLSIFIIFGSILLAFLLKVDVKTPPNGAHLISPALPDLSFFMVALVYLVLPQLPLTLGNAVFAASDISHQLWGEKAERVTPRKLGLSIGIINVFIGLFGGFPICHGSGGMAAHHQFGGKTGGTTIILGSLLILVSLFSPLYRFIFFIPLPVLGALLFITGLKMAFFIKKLDSARDITIAIIVAAIAVATRNLLFAVAAGFLLERSFYLYLRLRTRQERQN
jgi:MFS superfamily sulfate permease-like transporter